MKSVVVTPIVTRNPKKIGINAIEEQHQEREQLDPDRDDLLAARQLAQRLPVGGDDQRDQQR
jgi:hypothetical protein